MATKAKSKKADLNLGDWDKVYVLGGEPWKCQSGVQSAISKANASRVIRYSRHDTVSALVGSLTRFVWDDELETVVLLNPSADQIKACYECVMPGPISAAALIIVTPGDALDGRSAFSMKAKKADRVWYFDFPESSNSYHISQHLSEWEKDTKIKFHPDAKKWILSNAPTTIAKIKTVKGKADAEVYNLLELENELDKLYVTHEPGEIIDLHTAASVCDFTQTVDAFRFVSAVHNNDKEYILHSLDHMGLSATNQGELWLLASQLSFMMVVKSMSDLRMSESQILEELTNQKYLGKYLQQDWTEPPEIEPKSINPWRVNKVLSLVSSISAQSLANQYCATLNAIKDLRSGVDTEVIITYFALALMGRLDYSVSLKDR